MRALEIIQEAQQLDEVAMNPIRLRQEAASIGATAGMEFEMIVPNVSIEDEQEPDMDMDERVGDFSSVADFFNSGELNHYRDVDKFIEGLKEGYYEYAMEARSEQWADEGHEFFREYYEENEFDRSSAEETATEEIKEANPDLPEDSPEFEELVSSRVDEILDEEIDAAWDEQGRVYEYALEAWEDNADWPDEEDYLQHAYGRYMSDLPYVDYDVYWPYMTNVSDNDATGAAESFSKAVGRHVNVSNTYHGSRVQGEYTVEPDGSLDADSHDDSGLEFVSPPLPLDEMLTDLNRTVAWAKEYGCYTNDSTGLHMNVSVPNYSPNRLDYVKLALLLGDQYVLQQFGRLSNTYTKSALGHIKKIIQNDPDKTMEALAKMKSNLIVSASNLIHNGSTSKYTSINTKSGYIEFRSPGGDWLNADIPKLENTLLRFVVALDAACDPQKYRQEYLKKLYKLLEPTSDEYGIMVKDFSDYVAGVGGAPERIVKDFRRTALTSLQQSNQLKKQQQQKNNPQAQYPEPVWVVLNAAGQRVPMEPIYANNPTTARQQANAALLRLNPSVNTNEFTVVRANETK